MAYFRKTPCELNTSFVLTTAESRARIWRKLNVCKPPMTSATVSSNAVVLLLLLSHCAPIVCGGFVLGPCFVMQYLVSLLFFAIIYSC